MPIKRLSTVFAIFFLVFIVQESFINRINFFIGGFSLFLAFFVAWALHEEKSAAISLGFIAGFVADLSPTIESPFGLWTFLLTIMAFIISTRVRPALNTVLSPITIAILASMGSSIILLLYLLISAILGQEVGSITYVSKEILGHGLWSLILAPIYAPLVSKLQRVSLTARDR
jgi:rod shape-determining protein MreD